MSDEKILVAVYGTLKKGGFLHMILNKEKFLGEITFKGTMVDLRSFPAVVLQGDTDIHAELYEIDKAMLSRLDVIEGYPNFYNREQIETKFGKAWVYTQPQLSKREEFVKERTIKSGNWDNHESNR